MNRINKIALAVVALSASASSMAAGITDGLQTAATAAIADIGTAGGIVMGVVVAVAAVGWVRRVVR